METNLPASAQIAGLSRHIVDQLREAVLIVAPDTLSLVDLNQTACRILGADRESLLGRGLPTIECSLLDLFFWEDLRLAPQFDGYRIAESEWLLRDGSSLPVEKRVSSYVEDGRVYWVMLVEDLTQRRLQTEEQIRLATQLQSSLDATAEGILTVDGAGRVVNLNRRFLVMWQLPADLQVARNAALIFDYLRASLVDDSGFAASLAGAASDPERDTEDMLALQDGRYFVCVSKPEFLRDRLIGRVYSVRDITALKQVEFDLIDARDAAEAARRGQQHILNALRESENHLRKLINSSLIGIFQGEENGLLTEANNVLLELTGIERGDLLQGTLNWRDLLRFKQAGEGQQVLQELGRSGQTAPFEAELVSKEGTAIPVLVGLSRLEENGTELVGYVMDLTEQRKADMIKSEFISVVSHELRTPLTAIRGALGLIEGGAMGELPAGALQLVQVAHRNSQRLVALVNDILDMEKLMAGKMQIHLDRIDLVEQARRAIEANAQYAAALGVHYRLDFHPDQAWVTGDSDRLMQVFANLLSNAAKYSPSGDAVEVRVVEADGQFRVEVQDHGPGIPAEFQPRVFSKFAQADGTNTRRQGGTGLGLNITRTLVERMGGKIGFDTTEGEGSTFWFTLPAGVRRREDRAVAP